MTTREELAIIILLSFMLMLLIAKITLQNIFVDKSIDYIQISDKMQKIKTQNALLRNEVLQYESLGYINQQAQQMGMVRAKAIYIYK